MVNIMDVIEQHENTHGSFAETARITQTIKRTMRLSSGWDDLSSERQEALDNIAIKIGRILSGDPSHVDHWDDLAGYAMLARK